MEETLARFWHDLTSRPEGPFALRFVLQPCVAIFLAVRAGLRDAHAGRPAYLWTVFTQPESRRDLLRSGWKDIAKIFIMAVALDTIFQLVVYKWLYPLEALTIAFVLAIIPYSFVRGPVNRIASAKINRRRHAF